MQFYQKYCIVGPTVLSTPTTIDITKQHNKIQDNIPAGDIC